MDRQKKRRAASKPAQFKWVKRTTHRVNHEPVLLGERTPRNRHSGIKCIFWGGRTHYSKKVDHYYLRRSWEIRDLDMKKSTDFDDQAHLGFDESSIKGR